MFKIKHWRLWTTLLVLFGVAGLATLVLLPSDITYSSDGYHQVSLLDEGLILLFFSCLIGAFFIWIDNVDPKCVKQGKISFEQYLSGFFACLCYIIAALFASVTQGPIYEFLLGSAERSVIIGIIILTSLTGIILTCHRSGCKKIPFFKGQAFITA